MTVSGAILLLVLSLADLCCGALSYEEMAESGLLREIMLSIRIPRLLTAVVAGASMALAGAQMQAIFRNPLADPHIMGISAGAGTGAAVATVCASAVAVRSGGLLLASSAFLGAMIPSAVITAVSSRVRSGSTLLLFGVMLGFIFSAVSSLIAYGASQESLKVFYSWTAGSFGGKSYGNILLMGCALLTGLVLALLNGKGLDIILFGDEYAVLAGASVRRIRSMAICGSCILTGAVTAFCGPIGFVGMTAPHIIRMAGGSSVHGKLLPACTTGGACMTVLADIISLIWRTPVPVGSTMALLAVPLVIYVLIKGR